MTALEYAALVVLTGLLGALLLGVAVTYLLDRFGSS